MSVEIKKKNDIKTVPIMLNEDKENVMNLYINCRLS